MRRTRGFSLIELLMVVALTALIVGSLAGVYAYATRESADAAASVTSTRQAHLLMQEINRVVSNAVSCQVVTAGSTVGLKCIMPANGTDTNGDGYLDTYTPKSINKRGYERYGQGKRIWFYRASGTGAFNTIGTTVWRAQRNDDLVPTSTDKDTSFTFFSGTSSNKWNLIDRLQFTVDNAGKLTTVSVGSSQLNRNERTASAADVASNDAAKVVLGQTIFWRNWRK